MPAVTLPTVLLHDHLDGGLRPATFLELAAAAGVEPPATTPAAAADFFDQGPSGSLDRYLEAFKYTIAAMQTEAALERVAYEAVHDLAADGVIYAEFRFAPRAHLQRGLTPAEVVRAVAGGLAVGSRETGTETRLILDALRTANDSEEVARLAVASRDLGVVAFDLAGAEKGYTADLFLPACRLAAEGGLELTIHAGEADGLGSIAIAWKRCGAARIGHGVAIAEDCRIEDGEVVSVGRLAAQVRDRQLPLEMCPTSNLHTKRWQPQQHPIGALHRAGFAVTVNTDNRLMSRTSVSAEFDLLRRFHGFTDQDVAIVTRRALRAAFCPWSLKQHLWEERIRPAYLTAGVPVSPWE